MIYRASGVSGCRQTAGKKTLVVPVKKRDLKSNML
jgi:hypothetical protein